MATRRDRPTARPRADAAEPRAEVLSRAGRARPITVGIGYGEAAVTQWGAAEAGAQRRPLRLVHVCPSAPRLEPLAAAEFGLWSFAGLMTSPALPRREERRALLATAARHAMQVNSDLTVSAELVADKVLGQGSRPVVVVPHRSGTVR